MVYKTIKELPASIKKLPIKAQQMFLKAYNKSYINYGETTAFKIAWGIVKKQFKLVKGEWVAKGMSLNFYSFKLKNSNNFFINKASNGESYLEGILSTNDKDNDGDTFTEEALKSFAKQINEYGIAGFITHADWDEFKMKNSHLPREAFIAKARSQRKGILKTIKAVYEKGKLWIKALIDKRYVKRAKQFTRMSIEAIIPSKYNNNKVYSGGDVLGFALDDRAINRGSKIARITA